jgi:hypothetical protein
LPASHSLAPHATLPGSETGNPPLLEPPSPPSPPSEPLDPLDPLEPLDPLDPLDPLEPLDPLDPLEPLDPLDPLEPPSPGVSPVVSLLPHPKMSVPTPYAPSAVHKTSDTRRFIAPPPGHESAPNHDPRPTERRNTCRPHRTRR